MINSMFKCNKESMVKRFMTLEMHFSAVFLLTSEKKIQNGGKIVLALLWIEICYLIWPMLTVALHCVFTISTNCSKELAVNKPIHSVKVDYDVTSLDKVAGQELKV